MMSCNRFMTIKPRERAMKWFRLFIRTTATVATTFLSAQAVAQNERELLAATGRLRVGVYLGSPLSMVHDRATGEAKSSGVPDEEACSTFSERSRRRDCHRVRPHRGGHLDRNHCRGQHYRHKLNTTFSGISSQLK
jgi:hypothetical protein